MRWLALALLSACAGETGTIQLGLTTAPGSTILDGVQRLRVTLTDPLTIVEAPRTDSGFDLVIDVEARDGAGSLIVEGFDAGDSLIATGSSPPFAVSAINARVVVYIASPLSIAPAPIRLPAARTGVASTPVTFGFVIAGGEGSDGTLTDSIFVYNVFDHTLLAGVAMPAPRAFQAIATGGNNGVYLFGGVGADGAPTGSLWRFDTNAKPNGAFLVQPDLVELARAGASIVTLEPEHYVITGTPPVNLDLGIATARTDLASLGAGAGVIIDDQPIGLFGGDPVQRLADGVIEPDRYSTAQDSVAAAIGESAVGSAAVLFTSFRNTTEVLVANPRSTADPGFFADIQSVVRHRPAIAASARYVVIAGGTDDLGVPIPTADIVDLRVFQRIATVPCLARAGATALAMPNGQISIVGGEPANDAIELFTPPPAP